MHALDPALAPADLVQQLNPELLGLVLVCDALYRGDWDDLAEDVRRRQAGKPYLFRMHREPADLLGWATRLQAYERTRGERLAPYAERLSPAVISRNPNGPAS